MGGWITSRSVWLLELLTELTNQSDDVDAAVRAEVAKVAVLRTHCIGAQLGEKGDSVTLICTLYIQIDPQRSIYSGVLLMISTHSTGITAGTHSHQGPPVPRVDSYAVKPSEQLGPIWRRLDLNSVQKVGV